MIEATDFVAGAICLDFINTVGGHRLGEHDEKLESYADLLKWGVLCGVLAKNQAEKLAAAARADPDLASQVLRRAKRLREALHAIFEPLAKKRCPPAAALGAVNGEIGRALRHAQISQLPGRFSWGWDDPDLLVAPIWPIARDAGELLTSRALDRLAACASKTCGWLFVDRSRNRSRRWCAMTGCGNRDKIRRYRKHHVQR